MDTITEGEGFKEVRDQGVARIISVYGAISQHEEKECVRN